MQQFPSFALMQTGCLITKSNRYTINAWFGDQIYRGLHLTGQMTLSPTAIKKVEAGNATSVSCVVLQATRIVRSKNISRIDVNTK